MKVSKNVDAVNMIPSDVVGNNGYGITYKASLTLIVEDCNLRSSSKETQIHSCGLHG